MVYFQTIFYGAAWEDDRIIISPVMKDTGLMLESFYRMLPGSHFFPVSFLQCFLINTLFGKNAFPFGFHLYAYICHIFSCILAALIFYKLTRNKLISVIAVSLWTVHPINVETLTRLVCAPAHVPAGTFCLASLYFFLKILDSRNLYLKAIFALGGIFFFLASLTSYEQYILFPLVMLLIFYLFEGKKVFVEKQYLFFLTVPIVLVYLIYIIWRYIACGGSLFYAGNEFITWTGIGRIKDILFRAFWLAPQLYVHYLRLFFWPDFLTESQADWYKVGGSVFSFYSLFCQFIVIGLILSAILLRKKIPLFTIGVAWFFISMLPVIQIIPLFTIVDEHYCYIGVLGILLAVFSLLVYFKKFISPKLLVILILLIFSLLTWRTLIYLPTGKDRILQVVYRAKYSPPWTKVIYMLEALQNAKSKKREKELPGWLNLDNLRKECGLWLSKYLYVKADLSYKYGPMQNFYKYDTYQFLCRVLYTSKKLNELKILMKQAIEVKSDSIGYYRSAIFLREINEWGVAWEAIKNAISINPKFNMLYDSQFLDIAKNANKLREAEEITKNYIKLKPRASHPYLFAGTFYKKFNKSEEALYYYKQAISSDKIISINYKYLYFQAVNLFIENKMFDLAKQTLNVISSFDPFDKKVKKTLDIITTGHFQ